MAKVDLEALKATREGMAYWTWPRITGEVLDDIIAALEDREYLAEKIHTLSLSLSEIREDRERLRTVATLVYRRYLEGFDPLEAGFWSELRAELERRDG